MRTFRAALAIAALAALAAPGPGARAAVPANLYGALKWRSIGPYSGGRVEAVGGSTARPNVFYMGSAGGGVWKSLDYGLNWTNVSDGQFGTGVIGSLAVAPSNPDVVYVGTGEAFPRGDVAPGDGMYKTTDGGKTWRRAGLADSGSIAHIVVDPSNPDHVYAAVLGDVFGPGPHRGVYETTDGGAHWKRILHTGPQAGAVDLAMDPSNPKVLYAAMWHVLRKPWHLTSGGPGDALYKTTDGGAHWTNLSDNAGFPKGTLGKIGVAVAPSDPSWVYAIVEAKHGGIYRSVDGGSTWQRVNAKHEFRQRAFYYTTIFVDPQDKKTVYVPQVDALFRSTDGAKSFKPILSLAHGDNHVLWINPENPQVMIEGNDGGAEVTQNGGKSFTGENNQPTAQFYHVYVDNQFPYHVYGAQQDRGTISFPNRTAGSGISQYDWIAAGEGESGYITTPPGKPWIVYSSYYYSAVQRYDLKTQQFRNVDIWPMDHSGQAADQMKQRAQWTFPIIIPRNDPNVLYAGTQYVMKSTDGGQSWQRLSPDLTRNDKSKQGPSGGPVTLDNSGTETYDTVFALAVSPRDKNVIWAGTDDGKMWISRDHGKHWDDITPPQLPKWTTISIIDPSHFHKGTAYVAARRYRLDDFKPYLYKTTDYGKHWKKIVDGLPDDQSSFVIRQDPVVPNLLFAGTFTGVYVSFNGGAHWQPLKLDMPATPVRDLAIQARENDLVAATHGRGFWVMDNLKPLRQIAAGKAKASQPVHLFAPEHAYEMTGHPGLPGAVPKYEGKNPPDGAVFFYYLKKAPPAGEPVQIRVRDPKGNTVATFTRTPATAKAPASATTFYPQLGRFPPSWHTPVPTVPAKAGMNRFVWNLRYPDPTAVPGAYQIEGTLSAPFVVPGTYKVELTVGNRHWTQPVTVVADPRAGVSQADLEARTGLALKVRDTFDRMNKAIIRARHVHKALLARIDSASAGAEREKAKAVAEPLAKKIHGIESVLFDVHAHASEDNLWFPIRLEAQLEYLNSTIQSSLERPTRQDQAVYAKLSREIDAQLGRLHAAMQELPAVNGKLQGMGLAPVPATAPHGD